MARIDELPFVKGQALGNDYLVVDQADLAAPLTASQIRVLCERRRGIGSDGILLADIGEGRFRLRIFNPDGTEAEKSGNGLRIFAAYLYDRGLVTNEPFSVELPTESVTMQVLRAGPGGALDIVAEMGRASFFAEDFGFRLGKGEIGETLLDLGAGLSARVHPVSLGNPHCVVRVDELDRADFLRRAPRLTTHAAFAAGTNVQFARVTGPTSLEAWIFERGAGETLASGSSACAVAAVAQRLGWVDAREITIQMRGGDAGIEVRGDGMISLRGPAQIVYHGVVREVVAASW
jgi:diaminopimelate epimerase